MAFCTKCGSFVADNERFCSNCGADCTQQNTPTATATPNMPSYSPVRLPRSLNTPQLIWSIINLILCCMPLGIASLIMVLTAKDAPDDATAAKRNKSAMICNIIATVVGGIYFIGCFVYGVLVGLGTVPDTFGLLM